MRRSTYVVYSWFVSIGSASNRAKAARRSALSQAGSPVGQLLEAARVELERELCGGSAGGTDA